MGGLHWFFLFHSFACIFSNGSGQPKQQMCFYFFIFFKAQKLGTGKQGKKKWYKSFS